MGKLWGVYCEGFEENWPRYKGTMLYEHFTTPLDGKVLSHTAYEKPIPSNVWNNSEIFDNLMTDGCMHYNMYTPLPISKSLLWCTGSVRARTHLTQTTDFKYVKPNACVIINNFQGWCWGPGNISLVYKSIQPTNQGWRHNYWTTIRLLSGDTVCSHYNKVQYNMVLHITQQPCR